jgi:hypothetical protein
VLIAGGLNVYYVSSQLGHSSPAITLNVYAHEFGRDEHAARARDAMDAALSAGSKRVAHHPKTGGNREAAESGKGPFLHAIETTGN